jgi:hypothetical protein
MLMACEQRVELYPSTPKPPELPPPVLVDDGGAEREDVREPDAGLVDAGELDAGLVDAGLVDAGLVDAGEHDAGLLDASVADAGVVDVGSIPPSAGPGPLLRCDQMQTFSTDDAGLPLLQSNLGAPVALFIDFNGGTYAGNDYGSYDRNGTPLVFDAQEQADVVASFNHLSHYFSMFDVNVTTDDSVRAASLAWGWVLVSEDMSGGLSSTSAIGRPTGARGVCGASTARIENPDKSRRVAAMLGFNFTLETSGVWDGGTFWRWENFPAWDRQYGPILGGGGLGVRNGWTIGHHAGDPVSIQDDLEVIRQRVVAVAGSATATGWRVDDFPATTPASMCMSADAGHFAWGVLERPDDVDLFTLPWNGGDLVLEGRARDVSTAVITVDVLDGSRVVGGLGTTVGLAPGSYQLRVKSRGGYAELGAYEVRARH